MYPSIRMFAEKLHEYAQAMLEDRCDDAHRHAETMQRDAQLVMIDPEFIHLFRQRHAGVDPEASLTMVSDLLKDLVEYCRRTTATRCNPIHACRGNSHSDVPAVSRPPELALR